MGRYRSGYPNKKNFPFLKKMGLKSILYLCPEAYPDENLGTLTHRRTLECFVWCPTCVARVRVR
jgi:hypothetical protein